MLPCKIPFPLASETKLWFFSGTGTCLKCGCFSSLLFMTINCLVSLNYTVITQSLEFLPVLSAFLVAYICIECTSTKGTKNKNKIPLALNSMWTSVELLPTPILTMMAFLAISNPISCTLASKPLLTVARSQMAIVVASTPLKPGPFKHPYSALLNTP